MWTPLGSLQLSTKDKLLCRCRCGTEKAVRVADLLAGSSAHCRSCAGRARMMRLPAETRRAMARTASEASLQKSAARPPDALVARFGAGAVRRVRAVLVGARQRCSNPNNGSYANYGGRGVCFMFPNVRAAVAWVLYNLGPSPSAAHSLDRIDNDRHYEPGNLRWATRTEQARNRRVYRRTAAGERIRLLQIQRPDLTYETLRIWIKQGATDDEILQRRKYVGPRL